jgi:hypothetical protein
MEQADGPIPDETMFGALRVLPGLRLKVVVERRHGSNLLSGRSRIECRGVPEPCRGERRAKSYLTL